MMLVTTSSSTRLIPITSSSVSRSAAPKRSAISPSRTISARSLPRIVQMLDIEAPQHGGRRFVEQIGAPDVLEPVEEVVGAQPLFFGAAEVVQHGAAMHHHEAVAQMRG